MSFNKTFINSLYKYLSRMYYAKHCDQQEKLNLSHKTEIKQVSKFMNRKLLLLASIKK